MLISDNAGAHEDDRLEEGNEIIHKPRSYFKKMRRTRLWQVRLYRVVGNLNMRRGSNYCGTIS